MVAYVKVRITLVKRLVAAGVTAVVAGGLAATFWALAGAATVGAHRVVAAESAWGSLVPGSLSLVSSPSADPHDYEPTAADAQRLARARIVIVNGAGYDPWAQRLLDANPVAGRRVVDVAKLARVARGGNPHLWYAPAVVRRVAGVLGVHGLGAYDRALADLRRRFSGTPVGASESLFVPLARSLGLRLLTPRGLLAAVSEGTEPTARDLTAAQRQIERRRIRVWLLNTQNRTPDVARLTAAARRAGIPVVEMSELPRVGEPFASWQLRQLRALAEALAR